MPRKTCKLRLSRNSIKFDVVARFCETIPTEKSVLSSKIHRINFFISDRNYDFVIFLEIEIFSGLTIFHHFFPCSVNSPNLSLYIILDVVAHLVSTFNLFAQFLLLELFSFIFIIREFE